MSLVETYHPKLKDLGQLIKNLPLLLYSDSEIGRVFSSVSIVSYRSAGKIKNYGQRKLHPVERKVVNSRSCNRMCQVCTCFYLIWFL